MSELLFYLEQVPNQKIGSTTCSWVGKSAFTFTEDLSEAALFTEAEAKARALLRGGLRPRLQDDVLPHVALTVHMNALSEVP